MKFKSLFIIFGLILLNVLLVNAETVEISANGKINIDSQKYFTLENIEGISGEDWLVKNNSGKNLATYEDISISEGISYENVLLSKFQIMSAEIFKTDEDSIRMEKRNIKELSEREVIINSDTAFQCSDGYLITLGIYDHHIYKKSFLFSILREKSYPDNKQDEYYSNHAGTAYLKEDGTYLLNFGGEATYEPEEKGEKLQELCKPYIVYVTELTENSAKLRFDGCNNDGICDENYGESTTYCRDDCPVTRCGDGICSSGEKDNCPIDCNTEKSDDDKKTESITKTPEDQNTGNYKVESISNMFVRFINWIKNLFGWGEKYEIGTL